MNRAVWQRPKQPHNTVTLRDGVPTEVTSLSKMTKDNLICRIEKNTTASRDRERGTKGTMHKDLSVLQGWHGIL